jgi:hypothetical protein
LKNWWRLLAYLLPVEDEAIEQGKWAKMCHLADAYQMVAAPPEMRLGMSREKLVLDFSQGAAVQAALCLHLLRSHLNDCYACALSWALQP